MYPKGDCVPGFIYPEAHICAQTNNTQRADMVVFGDSHAFSAYWGISRFFGELGHNVRLIGKGSGCLPFINQTNLDCKDLINSQIAWINETSDIKTIFIIFRNPISNYTSKHEILNFEIMLRNTFDVFLRNKKRIVYLFSVPEARINPRLCIGDLPFSRRFNNKCEFLVSREYGLQKRYRLVLSRVLKDYPSVRSFNPGDVICPSGVCAINRGQNVMWTDNNHLSESASYIQGEALFKDIKI